MTFRGAKVLFKKQKPRKIVTLVQISLQCEMSEKRRISQQIKRRKKD